MVRFHHGSYTYKQAYPLGHRWGTQQGTRCPFFSLVQKAWASLAGSHEVGGSPPRVSIDRPRPAADCVHRAIVSPVLGPPSILAGPRNGQPCHNCQRGTIVNESMPDASSAASWCTKGAGIE